MSKPSVVYQDSYTPTFEKQLAAIENKDKIRAKRIREAMNEIRADPYHKIDFGKGQYRGKRKYDAGKDRVLFVVCEQCRKDGHTSINQCSDCHETKDETIVWAMIVEGHKY